MYSDLAIHLDGDQPLQQQLYRELRRAILGGRLLPKQKIPSTRSLAQSLGISRTTVTLCYEQLLSEGYLEAVVGSGTYVCAQIPDDLLQSEAAVAADSHPALPLQLSQYGAVLEETDLSRPPEPEVPFSFRYGRPALDQFPRKLWRKLLSQRCTAADWLDYTIDPLGYYPLREQIAQYLARARAVQCIPEQIVITNGSQQALDLILRLLIDPGDAIAMEDPGYPSARQLFLTQGATIIPVTVDEAGLRVCDLPQGLAIKLVHVTPSHQFPTGAILSLPRRLELLAWVQQRGALIIEDDYDSEYRYGERPIPALQGLDHSGSVLYIGTFSKVLFPSLRIGYLVLPQRLVALFGKAKWLCDRQLPLLEQQVLTDFIQGGHLEQHIRRMRSLYDQRRQTIVSALNHHFGKRVLIMGEQAGIHVMIKLQTSLSDQAVVERGAQVGVGLMSAQSHYLNPHHTGEFIFGYAELSAEDIKVGIRRLAQVLTLRGNDLPSG
ncbi:HTH-type transcriptional regulatory protein GabR [Acaryochloris thomasi RCC1774]|uniref:HTH-type transcriptional regulatory protein GabR n=1 Tax=Acaryochloris thomasi RCC1774 TaxID=1764569 RepID=A0A2W1JDS3_9CYAN|nr:PLP-dependent aminotransferase family protein [Acaryochloris thomasi]PZD71878.1 HTH-type transcriptional regulatory protein GabR [Acaryochloris thomasi RCC1774]